jgi:hypothetical protein
MSAKVRVLAISAGVVALCVAIIVLIALRSQGTNAVSTLHLESADAFSLQTQYSSTQPGTITVSGSLNDVPFSGTSRPPAENTSFLQDAGSFTGDYRGTGLSVTSTGWSCAAADNDCGYTTPPWTLKVTGELGGFPLSGECSRSSAGEGLSIQCNGSVGGLPISANLTTLAWGGSSWTIALDMNGIEYSGSGSLKSSQYHIGLFVLTGSVSRSS